MRTEFDMVIIGGGIVGLAAAYQLSRALPDRTIAILEKEAALACHQTGRNSGVIHSGLYYKPNSIKAVTCTQGRGELIEFVQRQGIKHAICGKIVVAVDEKERPHLETIYSHGLANGLEGIERLDAVQIREFEPHCAGIAGLHVPQTGIIDYASVAEKLAEVLCEKSDNHVLIGHCVTGFMAKQSETIVVTNKGDITAKQIINCGGLQSDRIARMAGVTTDIRIVPFRGDYLALTDSASAKINGLIYPVPDPAFPFLGVHFTRMIDNNVECGPSAVFSFKREGYSKTAFSLRDTLDSLTFPGTLRLFMRHMKFGAGEYARAFFKRLMLKQLHRLIPSLEFHDLRSGKSGIRAQALDRGGQLLDDFRIETKDNMIHVLNAPSPAATASFAIGQKITQTAINYFNLKA